jgi:hypothetical protein
MSSLDLRLWTAGLALALAVISGPAAAQRPPADGNGGTGGAAGYSPPPLDAPDAAEPMNAPPASSDEAPAQAAPAPDAAAPGDDIPDDSGEQPPPEQGTGADQPD